MILFYIFFYTFLIILIILLIRKSNIETFKQYLSRKEFDKLIVKSNEYNLYKVSLGNKFKIQRENCFKKCDYRDCVKLYNFRNNYKNCLKCQKNEDKCYKKLLTYGSCDDCNKFLRKNNCKSKSSYGCTDPDNIFTTGGIEPYFIEVPSNNSNSPFDSKCVFCWELKSYI